MPAADIEGAAPDEHLLVAVLRRGIGLVETLQRSVVALVELPGFDDGQPLAIHLAEHDVEGVDRALEARSVADVKVETGFFEGSTACCGFFAARVGELNIGPAGEQVELVPLGLSVTDEASCIVCWSAWCAIGASLIWHGVRAVCLTPQRIPVLGSKLTKTNKIAVFE